MNPLATVMVGIVIERLLVVLLAGVSIVLGWALFKQQLSEDGQAEFSRSGFRVVLRRIGPGVFFALFGSAVLGFVIVRPMSVEVTRLGDINVRQTPPVLAVETARVIGIAGSDEEAARKNTRALNTAIRLKSINRTDLRVIGPALNDLTRATPTLSRLRDQIVVNVIGKDALDLWNEKGAVFTANPERLSMDDRRQLAKMSSWFTETELQGD